MRELVDTNTIIIGAGASGLASAACLKRESVPFIMLDKDNLIGKQWRDRYDRLHLHTPKIHSALPFFKIPSRYPRYLSKNDFATYLDQYADRFGIKPYFNHTVLSVERKNDNWQIVSDKDSFHAKNVIVATGYARKPVIYDTASFTGEVIHSVDYKNGEKYRNKKVLIVGFGNSACEIAMCLYEHQAFPAMSVRSEVNIIPRDLAGIPIISIAIAQQWITKISPVLTDLVNQPVLKWRNGNLSKLGLKKLSYGPIEQIVKHQRIPMIDTGTLNLIRKKTITIYPEIRSIGSQEVEFIDGRKDNFDAIILATGFQPALEDFLKNPYASNGNQFSRQGTQDGLYLCGFNLSPTGMIREIGIEARKISRQIARART